MRVSLKFVMTLPSALGCSLRFKTDLINSKTCHIETVTAASRRTHLRRTRLSRLQSASTL